MPEKKRMKDRWVRLRRKCEFVRVTDLEELVVDTDLACLVLEEALVVPFVAASIFADATLLGSVSGRHKYRYSVSVTIKNSENPAAVANGFALTN